MLWLATPLLSATCWTTSMHVVHASPDKRCLSGVMVMPCRWASWSSSLKVSSSKRTFPTHNSFWDTHSAKEEQRHCTRSVTPTLSSSKWVAGPPSPLPLTLTHLLPSWWKLVELWERRIHCLFNQTLLFGMYIVCNRSLYPLHPLRVTMFVCIAVL